MKPVPDYYGILHITRNATMEDINRAFRRQSPLCHPDTNPHDPDATWKFQELSNAHDVLKDPESRRKYDRQLDRIKEEEYRKWRAMEKEKAARQQQEMLRRKQAEMERKKQAAARRTDRTDKTVRNLPALKTATPAIKYIRYEGQNIYWFIYAHLRDVYSQIRVDIKVDGQHRDVIIPPGFRDGEEIICEGCGEHGRNGGKNGDLIYICKILPDPFYKRSGNNLLIDIELDRYQASQGGYFLFMLPNKVLPVILDPPIRNGEVREWEREGFPLYWKPGEFGSLIVTFKVL